MLLKKKKKTKLYFKASATCEYDQKLKSMRIKNR